MSADLAVLIVLLTASSLYISSLSSSGVRAMVLSLPIGMAVAYFVQMTGAIRGLSLTLAPVLLWLAFVNHTSSERTALPILAHFTFFNRVLDAVTLRSRGDTSTT